MYFYSALCYFITVLSSTTSNVVLSANTEDLRKLAKEFGPESTVSNIYEVIKELIGGNKISKSDIEPLFRNEPVTEKIERTAETSRYTNNKMHYEVNINDLVDQVKQRIQNDLMRITAESKVKTIQDNNERLNKLITSSDTYDKQENDQETRIKLIEVQNKAIENEFRNYEADDQMLDQKREIQPSIYLFDQDKTELKPNGDYLEILPKVETDHRPREHKKTNKRKRKVTEIERISDTGKKTGILEGFNMMIKEDKSSKDYINHIAEDDHAETKALKAVQQNPYIQIKQALNQHNLKTKHDLIHNYEDETLNYNKKTNNVRSKYRIREKEFKQRLNEELQKESSRTETENIEQQIQPYAEQIQELELDGIGEPVTETGKARNDDISSNVYATPQDVTINEGNEIETLVEQQQDTISSERDVSEMGTHNDAVEIPVNAEKYNLNSFISEEDWVQDNFENI